jgi:hypothetical protein
VAYYHIVRDQVPYRDLGPNWQRKRYSVEHRARRLQRQLEALGYAVTLDSVEPEEQAPEHAHNPSRSAADTPAARMTLSQRHPQLEDSQDSLSWKQGSLSGW